MKIKKRFFFEIGIYDMLQWLPNLQQKGGVSLMEEILTSFLISVIASVVGYYICKWLDRDE